jgi:hypothetical protein
MLKIISQEIDQLANGTRDVLVETLLRVEAPTLAKAAEQYAENLSQLLLGVTLEGYAVAHYTETQIRLRVSGIGFKKFIAFSRWNASTSSTSLCPASVIYPIYQQKLPTTLERFDNNEKLPNIEFYKNNLKIKIREFVVADLEKKFGPQLQEKIDEAVQNVDVSDSRAKVQANIGRYNVAKHRAALLRLKEIMQGFRYTEEDVISTWNEVKVEQVLKG